MVRAWLTWSFVGSITTSRNRKAQKNIRESQYRARASPKAICYPTIAFARTTLNQQHAYPFCVPEAFVLSYPGQLVGKVSWFSQAFCYHYHCEKRGIIYIISDDKPLKTYYAPQIPILMPPGDRPSKVNRIVICAAPRTTPAQLAGS